MSSLPWQLPGDWADALAGELSKPYATQLAAFVAAERSAQEVFPPEPQVFTALALTPLKRTRVVILGQDPYHGPGQAHGLAFSVPPGVLAPPSLANVFKELVEDLHVPMPMQGSLTPWARQGVLLLNSVLTVRRGAPLSHRKRGWETLTDAVFQLLVLQPRPLVFVLWGKSAQRKAPLLEGTAHAVLSSAHPSPLSAYAGFFGSRPFSRVNQLLTSHGQAPIDWRLP